MIFRFPSTLVLSKRRMCCECQGKRRCSPITEHQKTYLKLLVSLGYNERHDGVADNLIFGQQEVRWTSSTSQKLHPTSNDHRCVVMTIPFCVTRTSRRREWYSPFKFVKTTALLPRRWRCCPLSLLFVRVSSGWLCLLACLVLSYIDLTSCHHYYERRKGSFYVSVMLHRLSISRRAEYVY